MPITTAKYETVAHAKLDMMVKGRRVVISDTQLDTISQTDYGSEIRSCRNRQRCGIQDAYVAWIHESAKPTDLEFLPGYAIGSV